jgi:serine/threonine protein kinase
MSNREVRPGEELLSDGARSIVTAAQPLRPRTTAPGSGSYPGVGNSAGNGVGSGTGSGTGEHPLQSALAALSTGPPSSPGSSPGHVSPSGTPSRPRAGLHATGSTPSLAPLARLGRYQVVNRIATGGMAEVYLAVHGELSGFRTPVVLKKVLPHLACNPHFIDMFLDEARIASLLDHPNVVRIYEVGRTGSEYFLAMELVQGKPFSAVVRRAHERQELIDHRIAAHIVAHAAAGLHHAHGQTDPLGNPLGLVHRDVSPQNILISFEGSVKVIDFGIARALGRISDTQTGGTKGKFGYMSPEQARGEDVDARTDIFALGVVLWEAVCGKRLFQRENDLATMRALIYDPIPRPSSVVTIAPELESIILRALSRSPTLRFQTARDLATALEKFVVSAGGVSGGDLSALIKGYFAADVATWQQTLRTAMNTPAESEPEPSRPVTVSALAPLPAPPRRRWPLFTGLGAVAIGLAAAIVLWTPGEPARPRAGGSTARAAVLPPTVVSPVPPAPPAVEPLPASPQPAAAVAEDPADRAANDDDDDTRDDPRNKSRHHRRHRTHDRAATPAAPSPPVDQRRPNPF